ALQLVEAAARAGAWAMKIQTYTADTMTIDSQKPGFVIGDPNSLWYGRNLYELYEEAHTPWEWHRDIFKRCRELGLICFSTPFDATAVDFLEEFDPPCYKIASFEIIDLPLIRRVAATGKPLIISCGMANMGEIEAAVQTAMNAGSTGVVLLKCTSSYPARAADANLATIAHLSQAFSCPAGLSDHNSGLGVSIAAAALGACMIEKHFILDRSEGGPDAAFSTEPDEMTTLIREAGQAFEAVGTIRYGAGENEKTSRTHRRSLYIVKDLEAGATLNNTNVRAIRPGLGLSPAYQDLIIGCRIKQQVKRGSPLSWDMLLQPEQK
ncbi:MAG TPA: pseudaminic acid synthase, partial [Desulfobacterales bacterium]|nr:pseudaminic acid synthase [Desulfobacterales bacterium]